jgi:hypothetical protein
MHGGGVVMFCILGMLKQLSFQVHVLDRQGVFLGWDWECELVERFCDFTVDGVRGWGVSEFYYRNRSGRPTELEMKDPEYARKAVKY